MRFLTVPSGMSVSWISNSFLTCNFLLLFAILSLFSLKISSLLSLIFLMRFIALMVFTYNSRLYFTGSLRFFSKSNTESLSISLPWAFLYALVHFILRGLCLDLKWRWHFERQNRNTLRTKNCKINYGVIWINEDSPIQKQLHNMLVSFF